MQDDPMDGNVIEFRIWCGFSSGYLLAQKPHPNPPLKKGRGRIALKTSKIP